MTLKLNWQVSEILQEIAMLSSLSDENPFKAKAMQNGARVIEKLEGDLKTLFEEGELKKVKGIGPLILSVVDDVVNNQPVRELARLRALIPEGLIELLKIPKLGPQKIRRLWQELDIKSLGELTYAIEENRLKLMKGFGEKSQEELKKALLTLSSGAKQGRMDEALDAFEHIKSVALESGYCDEVVLAGEASAYAEIVDEVEVLVRRHPVLDTGPLQVTETQNGEVPWKARDDGGFAIDLLSLISTTPLSNHHLKITLHETSNANSFGVMTLRLRSNQAFFDAIIDRAKSLGFDFQNDEFLKDEKPLPLPTEESVFDLLNIWFQPPCQRLVAAHLIPKNKPEPKLVTLHDLQGAFHNHTVLSDGKNTLEEMRDAAIARGLTYISINDHSQSAYYASGLKPEALEKQREEIAILNTDKKVAQCFLFSGTESDILANGDLDFSTQALASLDVVIASVHSRLKQDHDAMTVRLMNALKHPSTMILGHPTGRLLLSRPKSEFDFEQILDTARKYGVVMELNANPHRLDLSAQNVAMAKEAGVLIAINADAHSTRGFDDLHYGVKVAQRAGLRPSDVLNCLPLDAIRSFISQAKKKVSA